MVVGATATTINCMLVVGSVPKCENSMALVTASALVYLGFRIWEAVDVWTYPGRYNRRYRAIKARVEDTYSASVVPFILPRMDGSSASGANYGLSLAIRF